MAKLTNVLIEAAIRGFEAQKQDIDVQIAELRAMLTGAPAAADENEANPAGKPKRRKLSAAVRARMKAAQQLRWAKIKGTASALVAPATKAATKKAVKAAKPKGGITAAGRKAPSIAMKKRWAAKRARNA
jgi:hypothetical protein